MSKTKYETYPPTKMCEFCGGECCKLMACHYSPNDFDDLTFEGLKSEIEKGKIGIDWWEGKEREYYLRARHMGEPIVWGSWGGVCVNLTPTGCSLTWEDRPLGGKSLKPKSGYFGGCTGTYTKEICKNEWKKYSDVLTALVEYFV